MAYDSRRERSHCPEDTAIGGSSLIEHAFVHSKVLLERCERQPPSASAKVVAYKELELEQ